jgi:hypothetical protein
MAACLVSRVQFLASSWKQCAEVRKRLLDVELQLGAESNVCCGRSSSGMGTAVHSEKVLS